MRTIRTLSKIVAGFALSACALTANAALFEFSSEFSGSGSDCASGGGSALCGTLEVIQNGANVEFTLTADLEPGEFITGIYGNLDLDPFVDPVLGATGGTTDETGAAFDSGLNAFQADGDGQFDWVWDFTPAPPRLDGVETFTWIFTGADIDDIIGAISVNGPVGKNGFTFALRVQGLGTGNTGSGWFSSTQTQVPEPGSLALLALGLLLISGLRGGVFRRS